MASDAYLFTGYDRAYPEGSFPYAGPIYGSQPPVSSSVSAPVYQHAPQHTQMEYSANQTRPSYDDQAGPYLNVGSTPVPEITNYAPSSGTQDTKFHVYFTTLYELMTANTPIFFLMFGQRKCKASLRKLNQAGGVCTYSVVADVPQVSATGYPSSTVPVVLFMESGDGDIMSKVPVGDFTYVDGGNQSGNSTPQVEMSRKRKISSDSSDLMKSPAKRPSSQQLRPKEEYGAPYYASTDSNASYSPYMQSSNNYGTLLPQYGGSRSAGYQGQQRHMAYQYPTSATSSPPTLKAPSPQVGHWASGYPSVSSSLGRGPGLPSNVGVSRPALSSLPAPSLSANPPLIRTSTLQQTPSPATTPHGGNPGQHFNAYALYTHKAKLEIQGDLDAMAQNWSDEEFESRRRLVHFRRSQSGSTITTTFQPVSVDDRPQNSVCISCIYWEEKEECFVTSVDTIYLLEQLVAARFTVEEKNRIRRNLEGFRPLTVSKGKSDSEEFFKVIMGFPAPKPRNIEKDVKVFHWKDLASALKKIIGKYVSMLSKALGLTNISQSASPSSTLPPGPALLTPVSSTGYPTEGSSGGLYSDHHGANSPRSISGSTTSTAYISLTIPARVLSPHNHKSLSTQGGGPPDLRINPHESSSHWQPPHHMQGSQYQQLGSQSGRSSWGDMSGYLDNSPATTVGTSSSSYPHPRTLAETAVPGGDNRVARSLSSQNQQVPRS